MKRFTVSPKEILVIPFLLAAGLTHFQTYYFFQPDDTFIFLVYAKNLLNGNGLTFNGEVVEGFSSLSWTLIVSFFGHLITTDLLDLAKIAGGLTYLGLATLIVTTLKRRSQNITSLDCTVIGALFYAMPPLAIWAASGMETIFFSLLLATALLNYLFESNASHSNTRGITSGLLFGMLAITRPEGFALIAIPCCYELANKLLLRTANWKTLSKALVTLGFVVLLLLLWRKLTFGEWLPTTVHAKTGNLRLQVVTGINYVGNFCCEYFYLVIAYMCACLNLLFRHEIRSRQFGLMSTIAIFGYLLFIVTAGGDWMISYRLITPLLPIVAMTIGLAISSCRTATIKIILTTPLVVLALIDSRNLYPIAVHDATAARGDIILGEYIRSLNLPSSAKIAVVDAGAIPYVSDLPTIDMIGLNNSHIAKLPGGFFQKFDNKYVLAQQPAIIQMHTIQRPSGDYLPTPDFMGTVQLFYSGEFQKNYEMDHQSQIRHLFKRRKTALTHSMMDSFHNFSATLINRDDSVALRVTKTGAGLWMASPTQQFGSVHINYRVEDRYGKILSEKSIPLSTDATRGGTIDIALTPQDIVEAARIVIDPVLVGVARFSDSGKSLSLDVAL